MVMAPRFTRKQTLIFLIAFSVLFLSYANFQLLDPLFECLNLPFRRGSNVAASFPTNIQNDLPGERNTRVLLISAFFPLANTSYTFENYKAPLSSFLSRITTDVYFFTPPHLEPAIRKLRGHLPISINTTYSTPFEIPPLENRRGDYIRMQSKDRESENRSIDFYAFNTAKHFFLREGLENVRHISKPGVGAGYRYAFWFDPGTFEQEHSYQTWPSPSRLDIVWDEGYDATSTISENLMYFPMVALPHQSMIWWTEAIGPIHSKFIESTFFGGRPSAIEWWYKAYFAYHDAWLRKGAFVGRDQAIVNGLFILFPSKFITTWLNDFKSYTAATLFRSTPGLHNYNPLKPPPKYVMATPLGQCHDASAYHVFYLASVYERDKMATAWIKRRRWAIWPWQWLRQMNTPKVPCTLTRITSVESLLRLRVFGRKWRPPRASVVEGRV